MVRMVALQRWRGREGAVNRGDVIDVDEARAKQLEGYDMRQGRAMTMRESDAGDFTRHGPARARRLDDGEDPAEDKGGATVPERGGHTEGEANEVPAELNDARPSRPGINATDGAQQAADEKGIDLSQVPGTGKDGRVTAADVKAHLGQ